MANYYNVIGWKRTGFNPRNRPINREVLNKGEFTGNTDFFMMKGVALNRDDMAGITHIDLQGSVKDLKGGQQNSANSVGSHGGGGPFYSWEEVDYIRLARTGYPQDEDFVNIAGSEKTAWQLGSGSKMFVGYYFVTGMKPLARNVTRIYLMFDVWTSCMDKEECRITSGVKVRGHIKEQDDILTYNLADEKISLTEPLEIKEHKVVKILSEENKEIIISSTDLTQYTNTSDLEVEGLLTQTTEGLKGVVPRIKLTKPTNIGVSYPSLNQEIKMVGLGAYEPTDVVKHNIGILYSLGQLELSNSYIIPSEYVSITQGQDGHLLNLKGSRETIDAPLKNEVMEYPRKAQYLCGSFVLVSNATGDMDMQPYHRIENSSVLMWSDPSPNGSPFARFNTLKNHPHPYSNSVIGANWVNKVIGVEGASGSFWHGIQNAFGQQANKRQRLENAINWSTGNAGHILGLANTGNEIVRSGAGLMTSLASVENYLQGGKESKDGIFDAVGNTIALASGVNDMIAFNFNQMFKQQANAQALKELNAGFIKSMVQSPFVDFAPTMASSTFSQNTFIVYNVNVSKKDLERLRTYFRRYGYNGLYEPLTFENMEVKTEVNYIEAEGVEVEHDYYPQRVLAEIKNILERGVFLWSKKPNPESFKNNADK